MKYCSKTQIGLCHFVTIILHGSLFICITILFILNGCYSVTQSWLNSLQTHRLQHTRPPCLSPSPTACLNSYSLSWWCYPTISYSVIPFSCLQSFPTSGSFPVNQLFTSGGQSIGALASASVLPVNIQGWFSSGWTGFDLLAVQGTLKSLLQHQSSKASVLLCSAFFIVQLSLTSIHDYWKNHRWTFA